jgi:hypothetical protein
VDKPAGNFWASGNSSCIEAASWLCLIFGQHLKALKTNPYFLRPEQGDENIKEFVTVS